MLGYLLALSAIAVAVSGVVAYGLELRSIDRDIAGDLTLRAESFLQLAERGRSQYGAPVRGRGSAPLLRRQPGDREPHRERRRSRRRRRPVRAPVPRAASARARHGLPRRRRGGSDGADHRPLPPNGDHGLPLRLRADPRGQRRPARDLHRRDRPRRARRRPQSHLRPLPARRAHRPRADGRRRVGDGGKAPRAHQAARRDGAGHLGVRPQPPHPHRRPRRPRPALANRQRHARPPGERVRDPAAAARRRGPRTPHAARGDAHQPRAHGAAGRRAGVRRPRSSSSTRSP